MKTIIIAKSYLSNCNYSNDFLYKMYTFWIQHHCIKQSPKALYALSFPRERSFPVLYPVQNTEVTDRRWSKKVKSVAV